MNISGFDPPMRERFYKGVCFDLLDSVVQFVLDSGVSHVLAMTWFLPVRAYTEVLRSTEISCNFSQFSRWYSYDYRPGKVSEVFFHIVADVFILD